MRIRSTGIWKEIRTVHTVLKQRTRKGQGICGAGTAGLSRERKQTQKVSKGICTEVTELTSGRAGFGTGMLLNSAYCLSPRAECKNGEN